MDSSPKTIEQISVLGFVWIALFVYLAIAAFILM